MLKGGLLLAAFDLRRATRDVHLLALRTDNDPAAVKSLLVAIASVVAEDAVVFLLDTITAVPIRDDDVYPGVRAVLEARPSTPRSRCWRRRSRSHLTVDPANCTVCTDCGGHVMTRMGLTEARESLPDATNRVAYGGERITIQRRGRDMAALVSMEDLRVLEALDNQADVKAIADALAEQGDEAPQPWHAVKAELGLK